MDYKTERDSDVEKIKGSRHPRKVVVAGPGTGKSHLFSELIKEKKKEGKANFLAITFVGKLCDALADDLCGMAETVTLHSFARKLVLESASREWVYYADIFDVIKEDLAKEGVKSFTVGDKNYLKKSLKYKAVGNEDVVYYALRALQKKRVKMPKFDLVLVDEYQDFNEIESAFIDELAKENEIVLVGDDDQALYLFKGSSPEYIRDKHHDGNADWESHTLRFCSRCTSVILKYFHAIVEKYELNNSRERDHKRRRIGKQYICYVPDKEWDSQVNPKIHFIKACPPGMLAYKIKEELTKMTGVQKIKDALVIGEPTTCKSMLSDTGRMLKQYGFRFVNNTEEDVLGIDYRTLDAYRFLGMDKSSVLGWRLLDDPDVEKERAEHLRRAATLQSVLNRKGVADSSKDKLIEDICPAPVSAEKLKRDNYIQEIKQHFQGVSRPVSNIEITVCNIISSKGLGADVVFIVGFDQGRLPKTKTPTHAELYQMLVALTRAKKRVYLINTVERQVSSLIESLEESDIAVDDMTGMLK